MKKLLLTVLFLLPILFIFTKPSFAQIDTSKPPQQQSTTAYPLNTNPDVPNNFHTYTQNVFIEVLSAATCIIGGTDILNPQEKCLGVDPETKKIGYIEPNGGLMALAGNMIGSTFNIPVSSTHYGHYLATHFGITRTSLAANETDPGGGGPNGTGLGEGIGFVGLTPVLEIWKTFRNLTYLLFVFIFILLGLGIMFRLNIDARTVMTIQNQLPKIIIGLILITLSYAIAGFLIDMMYVGIYLVIHIFNSQGLTTLTNIATNPIMAVGDFGGVHGIAAPAAQGVQGMVESLFSGSIGNWVGMLVGGIVGTLLGGSILQGIPGGGLIGGLVGGAIGLFGGNKMLGLIALAIAYLIISVAIFSALFRVWFMLIKAYVFIFLDVIFAPFWIVGGLLPGAPGGVGPWLRSLIANLAAFPTVIVLFMVGKTIQDKAFETGTSFIPPLIGNPGDAAASGIASILGLGIILIMPEAVTITKSTLKAPELKYTAAIGKAIGAGQGLATAPIRGAWKGVWGENRDGTPKPLKKYVGFKAGEFFANNRVKTITNRLPFAKKVRSLRERAEAAEDRRYAERMARRDARTAPATPPPPTGGLPDTPITTDPGSGPAGGGST